MLSRRLLLALTAAGLLPRPIRAADRRSDLKSLETTLRALLAWHAQRPAAERDKLQAGLGVEAERALLAVWRAKTAGG
jgi:hypothetical protein